MTAQKITVVAGYDIDATNPFGIRALGRPPQGAEIGCCEAWEAELRRSVALAGHWSAEAAMAYARRRGWRRVQMTHARRDLSGAGRHGHMTWALLDGAPVVRVLVAEA